MCVKVLVLVLVGVEVNLILTILVVRVVLECHKNLLNSLLL